MADQLENEWGDILENDLETWEDEITYTEFESGIWNMKDEGEEKGKLFKNNHDIPKRYYISI